MSEQPVETAPEKPKAGKKEKATEPAPPAPTAEEELAAAADDVRRAEAALHAARKRYAELSLRVVPTRAPTLAECNAYASSQSQADAEHRAKVAEALASLGVKAQRKPHPLLA
jgi:hypothetical protein